MPTTKRIFAARKIELPMIRFLAQRIYAHIEEVSKILSLNDEQRDQLVAFTGWLCDHGLEYIVEREDRLIGEGNKQ